MCSLFLSGDDTHITSSKPSKPASTAVKNKRIRKEVNVFDSSYCLYAESTEREASWLLGSLFTLKTGFSPISSIPNIKKKKCNVVFKIKLFYTINEKLLFLDYTIIQYHNSQILLQNSGRRIFLILSLNWFRNKKPGRLIRVHITWCHSLWAFLFFFLNFCTLPA